MRIGRFHAPAAVAISLTSVLIAKLRLGWSSDDVGTAWSRLQLNDDYLSSAIWSNPHFNRFPLNSAWALALHGDALNPPWIAHLASWLLIVATAWLGFRALEGIALRAGNSTPGPLASFGAAAAVVWFLTGEPFAMSLFDVSCSHYLMAASFFFAAVLVRIRFDAFWSAAALCGIGTLASEVGLFLAAQWIVLDAVLAREWPWRPRRIAWLAAAVAPFVLFKALLYVLFGREALVWKAYAWAPGDALFNSWSALRYVFFPREAIAPWALGLVGALALWRLRSSSTPLKTTPSPDAGRTRALFFLAIFGALVPFVFLSRDNIAPRLFSELALVAATWSLILPRALPIARPVAILVATLFLANHLALFGKHAKDSLAAESIFRDFLAREAEPGILSAGKFTKGLAIAYRTPVRGPLEADWGMKLAVSDSSLREKLLGWPPLNGDQLVAIDYKSESKLCLPKPMAPETTELLVFSDREAEPPSKLDLCDAACSNCRTTPARAVLRR